MKKILICGNYGAKNTGDELILLGTLNLLKNFDISVLSEHHDLKYEVKHFPKFPSGLSSLKKYIFSKKDNLKALKECDLFLLGGGNLFAGPSFKANIIWGIQALFSLFYRKKLIIYCQSIGDNNKFFLGKFIAFLFNKADEIYLRDEISANILKKYGVKNQIKIIADPAFMLTRAQKTIRTKTLISLRQISNINQNFIQEIFLFLKPHSNISFLSFDTGKENDQLLAEKVIDRGLENAEILDYVDNPINVLNEFETADFAICMRLHSIICAIISCTPFIAIKYAKKIESFLKYANLSELMIAQEDVSVEILNQKLAYIKANKEKITQKMMDFTQNAHKKLSDLNEELNSKLKN
jgi:polysaccharide pyruvyl transferase WcaK-like protein